MVTVPSRRIRSLRSAVFVPGFEPLAERSVFHETHFPSQAAGRIGGDDRVWRRQCAAQAHPRARLTKVTLALDWYPNANHAGLFLAQERGYFAEAGLEVELYTPSDPTVVLQTVGAGRDDFGISYQTDVLLARAAGGAGGSDRGAGAASAHGRHVAGIGGITRPADLVGKTDRLPRHSQPGSIPGTMMASDGASIDDVELINVGFDLVPAVDLRSDRCGDGRLLDPRDDPGRAGGLPGFHAPGGRVGRARLLRAGAGRQRGATRWPSRIRSKRWSAPSSAAISTPSPNPMRPSPP